MVYSSRVAAILSFVLFALQACVSSSKPESTEAKRSRAEIVVDSAIAFHGYIDDGLTLGFSFRDKEYTVSRKDGIYKYTATYHTESGRHVGLLTNEGYSESVNGGWANLTPKDSTSRAESINSVVYFALLPLPLNDAAARKSLDGEEWIHEKEYYRIKVVFDQEGGGNDHDDVFFYWFDKADFSMDYLAYTYASDESGSRFRVAQKARRINGVLFQDYLNYKGPASTDSLSNISELYKAGRLELLSEVELSRVSLRLSDGRQ